MTRKERTVYAKSKLKPLPNFKSEEEERVFWATRDSTDYIDWSKGERVAMPNLKPKARTISIRFPVTMITMLKLLANERHMPYQSFLKTFLADRLKQVTGLWPANPGK
jgi:predicted DNA binding CopG/RHH family protein